jgi:sortase A
VSVQPTPTRRKRTNRADIVVRAIGILGRIFVLAGLLLLFFTSYLLWGTGLYTKKAQETLVLEESKNPVVGDADIKDGKIPPARPKKEPGVGSPLFTIKIPKIGLDTVVVNGVGVEELKKGPGLFPSCGNDETGECVSDAKYPGEKGNVAISGHRTTYGAPFFRLEELKKGDTIDFTSGPARYRYRVESQKIVDPVGGFSEVEQRPGGKSELTLTTCHPRFSAAQRLIIKASYAGASRIDSTKIGDNAEARDAPVIPTDVLVLGGIALVSALGSLALSRRYQKTAVYLTTALGAGVALWILLFPWVVTKMPANY